MIGEEKIIVGLRFSKAGRVYNFTARRDHDLQIGDYAVVETSRGWQLGEVVQFLGSDEVGLDSEARKPISRRATPQDLLLRQSWQKKEEDVVKTARAKAIELGYDTIKIDAAEYSFEGSSLTVLFSTEGEEKVDLRSIKKALQRTYSPARVELRQIGPRDVAKFLEGMGACGLEKRCCSKFLMEFNSISIKMAKEQGISLTPTEITGMCGRLRCCLNYEFEQYTIARKGLPKRNKKIMTPAGEGKVIDVLPLKGTIVVYIPEVGRREFSREELKGKLSEAPSGPEESEEE